MDSATSSDVTPPTDPGLPPVKPLTAGYMVQLFLVPGLIVVGLVGVLMVINYFNPFAATPQQFLERLDDPNPDVRWRAASDLADVLVRNDNIALDAHFALGIAERLKRAREQGVAAEKALATLTGEDLANANKARETDRLFVQYLAACLGYFRVPVGLTPLMELAENRDIIDKEESAKRRRGAWFALALMGERLKGFESLTEEQRLTVMIALEEESQKGGDRGTWAKDALAVIRGQHAGGSPTMLTLNEVAARCAVDDDVNVRKFTAYALMYWNGSKEQNDSVNETLLQLAQSAPTGTDNALALQVSYTAATSLAKRGSIDAPVGVLVNMLNEEKLERSFRVKLEDQEQTVPDTVAIYATIGNALEGLEVLCQSQPPKHWAAAIPHVERLTGHSVSRIASQAQKTLAALRKS
jgi:hypothetical protein